jgi:DNA replication protein DnaC
MRLISARRFANREREYRSLDCVDLLLIDELGCIPFERAIA